MKPTNIIQKLVSAKLHLVTICFYRKGAFYCMQTKTFLAMDAFSVCPLFRLLPVNIASHSQVVYAFYLAHSTPSFVSSPPGYSCSYSCLGDLVQESGLRGLPAMWRSQDGSQNPRYTSPIKMHMTRFHVSLICLINSLRNKNR